MNHLHMSHRTLLFNLAYLVHVTLIKNKDLLDIGKDGIIPSEYHNSTILSL